MRRKIGAMLIIIGLIFSGWSGYSWLTQMSSSREAISASDIVEEKGTEKAENENFKVSADAMEKTAAGKLEDALEEDILVPKKTGNPPQPKQRDYKEYNRGDEIGWLLIPSLDMKYPLYWGTDDETLTQGVGYHVGKFTTPPDGRRHTVLSGHRDTVFRELGVLKEGDKMYVQFEGIQYEYEIAKTWVTDAEDRTVIVEKEEPVLTLTTCYPFTFIGAAPDRYIIEAPLVNTAEMES